MTGFSWSLAACVGLGGAVGSIARWAIGLWLNPVATPFALGTWVVNAAGGLLIGAALVWFERWPNEPARLLLVTGFLGGLTTFSAFSAESLGLVLRGELPLALAHSLAHLLAGLLCAALGWWLMRQGLS